MGADFTIQPLLNKSEARVFSELHRAVSACNPTWHVMAQVSLGEILVSADAEAYRCINAKRVDLLLVDGDCRPRHAIEYQGGAHHQGTAAARDAVKKEALRRAGIGYHEVIAGFTTPSELRRLVEKLVDKPDALPQG
jgi:GAF domain-containing protein